MRGSLKEQDKWVNSMIKWGLSCNNCEREIIFLENWGTCSILWRFMVWEENLRDVKPMFEIERPLPSPILEIIGAFIRIEGGEVGDITSDMIGGSRVQNPFGALFRKFGWWLVLGWLCYICMECGKILHSCCVLVLRKSIIADLGCMADLHAYLALRLYWSGPIGLSRPKSLSRKWSREIGAILSRPKVIGRSDLGWMRPIIALLWIRRVRGAQGRKRALLWCRSSHKSGRGIHRRKRGGSGLPLKEMLMR